MRAIVIFLILSISASASMKKAMHIYKTSKDKNKNAYIAQELYKSKYYFGATAFLKRHIIETDAHTPELEDMIEYLIIKTGNDHFFTLKNKILRKWPSPALHFVLGIKLFKYQKYDQALKYLKDIKNDHRFAPEALLTRGSIYNVKGNQELAYKEYDECISLAKSKQNDTKNDKLKRYYSIMIDTCQIHKSRLLYKLGKYEEAKTSYEQIAKKSYRWPYILIEKAWNAYKLEDYNRTLGVLVTYKSPLMTSYFFPEGEVLSALSYYKLCLFEDSLKKIEEYYEMYKPRSDELKKFLVKHKKSNDIFLRMILSPIKESEDINPFVRNLLTQIRKKVIFNIDLVNYKRAQNEKNYINKLGNSEFEQILKYEIKSMLSYRTKKMNHFVKRIMFNFINEIHRYSYEMFNIKLEIMSKKRDLVYKNKKLISDRSRGSHENVKRESDQHFYEFTGEFWADELGDYSFGLKSNCELVKDKSLAAGI